MPADKVRLIKEKLESLPEDRQSSANFVEMKSPTTFLILSILLGNFGIDRFLLGQVGLGILKLVTFGGIGVWTIIDRFLIMEITKEDNFNRLMAALN